MDPRCSKLLITFGHYRIRSYWLSSVRLYTCCDRANCRSAWWSRLHSSFYSRFCLWRETYLGGCHQDSFIEVPMQIHCKFQGRIRHCLLHSIVFSFTPV